MRVHRCCAALVLLFAALAAYAQPLVFLGDKDLPPFEFLQEGRPAGANVDLMRAIALRMGRDIEVRLVDWSEAQSRVLAGQATGLTMLGRTPEREQHFRFSAPTVPVRFALFVRADEAGRFGGDLAGRPIAVTRSGLARVYLQQKYPAVVPVEVNSLLEAVRLLLRREVDAIAGQEWAVYYLLGQLGAASITGLPPYQAGVSNIAVRRQEAALLPALDAAIAQVRGSGEFDRILDRWSSTRLRVVPESTITGARWGAAAAVAVIAVLATALVLLRRRDILLTRQIEERKAVEARLEQAKRQLEAADENKNRFLATLSHELRNPLAPIQNALLVLERHGHEPTRVQWARELMGRQVQHLRALVEELSDIGRISNGQLSLQVQRLPLRRVLLDAIETVRPLMDGKEQKLSVELDEAGGIAVPGDAQRLYQVFVNLLTNAMRYTPPAGSIAVTARADQGMAVVRVSDSGIGIPDDVAARLFDMFHREPSAAERAPEGLGLGLWLCLALVKLHGGSLRAHSAGAGCGAEFIVSLPLAAASPVDEVPSEPTPAAS